MLDMEATTTPGAIVATLAVTDPTDIISAYKIKRSAKKIITEACAEGWVLTQIEDSPFSSTATFVRSDGAGQAIALAAQTQRNVEDEYVQRKVVTTAKVNYDTAAGAFYGAVLSNDGEWAQRCSTPSETLDAMHAIAVRVDNHAERIARDEQQAEQRRSTLQEQADFQAAERAQERYIVSHVEGFYNYFPEPLVWDEWTLRNPERMVTAAQEAAVLVIAKNLAARALKTWGMPSDKASSSLLTLNEAVSYVCNEAFRSYDYRRCAEQLAEAVQKLDRGY